ncbi:MAG TPA: DUF6064 family protein, partial [Leptospiraceae bacterium]|nr:DUF6064 family protein [Leptospiraceae bacterium]
FMKIPFTTEQFLGVFAAYNQSVWPAQVALFAAALVILALSLKTFSFSSIMSGSILGVLWIWMGIAYHIVQFTSINPAAYVFGIACILQGLIFLWNGFRRTLEFRFSWDVRGWAGGLLILYALILYPIVGSLLGHVYPSSPTFGLPCPTTIFTFGMLLWVRKPPLIVLIIPVLWSIVGFSAALQLGIKEDVGLPMAAALVIILQVFATKAPQPVR